MTVATVELWGTRIGAVAFTEPNGVTSFAYEPSFLDSGVQLVPLMMPLAERVYSIPVLARRTFRGLPGLLADSLPDRYGNNPSMPGWPARAGCPRAWMPENWTQPCPISIGPRALPSLASKT